MMSWGFAEARTGCGLSQTPAVIVFRLEDRIVKSISRLGKWAVPDLHVHLPK